MGKAILEFDLNDPDDRINHKQCIEAGNMASVIWDFVHNSKKTMEWTLDEKVDLDRYEVLDMVYDRFYLLLEENNVNIDELVV